MVLQLWAPVFGTESHQSHLNPRVIHRRISAMKTTPQGFREAVESMNSASLVKASAVDGWRFSRLCCELCTNKAPLFTLKRDGVERKSFKMCFWNSWWTQMFLIRKQDCGSKLSSVIKVNCRKEFIWLTSLPSWMSWIYMARTKRTMPQFVRKDHTSPNHTWAVAKTEANWMELELTCYLLYLLSWGTRQWSRQRGCNESFCAGPLRQKFQFFL